MKLKTAYSIVRSLGPGWVAFRCWKSVSEKFGYWERRIPSLPWHELSQKYGDSTKWNDGDQLNQLLDSQGVKFFFDGKTLPDASRELQAFDPSDQLGVQLLNQNIEGRFPFFSGSHQDLGPTPDWFRNPLANLSAPRDVHFSKINEFGYGDVKAIWELNRFGFVYDLVRAYGRTGDAQCGERFWQLFENWYENNPPFAGVNWKCGQESGLRMIAVVFGYFAFRHHPSFSGEMASKLMGFLAATGLRIERHIGYAISQKNNHGISEAVALWTLGVLFPNLRSGASWKQKGQDVLDRLCKELIYEDGGFCQHSANYHRLLLHLLAWTVELAKTNQVELTPTILERFKMATDFLFQISDPVSGRVPRYGNDDGALLFPLNNCDYQDCRPVVRLCYSIINQSQNSEGDPWGEDQFWFGLSSLPVNQFNEPLAHWTSRPTAGCHVIRAERDFAFARAGSFKHRPCQLDMMHVDLWSDGNNIALDAGTYSYNGEAIWKDIPFSRGDYHNTITIDRKEPARRISKFLFVPWPESRLVAADSSWLLLQRQAKFEASDVDHRRLVAKVPNGVWVVLDQLDSDVTHHYRLHWLLGGKIDHQERENQISLRFNNGQNYHMICNCHDASESSIIIADEQTGRGFFAPRYLERAPANSFAISTNAQSTQFVSWFGPDKAMLESIAAKKPVTSRLDAIADDKDTRLWVANLIQEIARA